MPRPWKRCFQKSKQAVPGGSSHGLRVRGSSPTLGLSQESACLSLVVGVLYQDVMCIQNSPWGHYVPGGSLVLLRG